MYPRTLMSSAAQSPSSVRSPSGGITSADPSDGRPLPGRCWSAQPLHLPPMTAPPRVLDAPPSRSLLPSGSVDFPAPCLGKRASPYSTRGAIQRKRLRYSLPGVTPMQLCDPVDLTPEASAALTDRMICVGARSQSEAADARLRHHHHVGHAGNLRSSKDTSLHDFLTCSKAPALSRCIKNSVTL